MQPTVVIQKAPVKPMYICLFIAWAIFILPIPFTSFLAYPLIAASIILSVICLSRNDFKNGIIGLVLIFIGSPLVYLIGLSMFASILGSVSQSN